MNKSSTDTVRDWIMPEGVRRWLRCRTIERRFCTRVSMDDRRRLAHNAALRNRHAGRRCLVIGNGPSLSGVDLTKFNGDITIAMNSISRHPAARHWSPTYYCRAEPGSAYDSADRVESIRELTRGMTCDGYFFPLDAKQTIERQNLLPAERTYYFKSIVDLTEWPVDRRPLDLTDGIPFVGNTAQFAILLALYLGANPVILLGMDHDFLAHRSINRHFYDATPSDAGGTDDLRTYSYKKMMADTLREWERYEVIDQIASRVGVKILNATEGGFLDVFPQVSMATILPMRSRACEGELTTLQPAGSQRR